MNTIYKYLTLIMERKFVILVLRGWKKFWHLLGIIAWKIWNLDGCHLEFYLLSLRILAILEVDVVRNV